MLQPEFKAPGPGSWELEQTHFAKPVTRYVSALFAEPLASLDLHVGEPSHRDERRSPEVACAKRRIEAGYRLALRFLECGKASSAVEPHATARQYDRPVGSRPDLAGTVVAGAHSCSLINAASVGLAARAEGTFA